MDKFLIKYFFINSIFYLISIQIHKVRSYNWRIDKQPTMKYLKINNILIQLLLILSFGIFIFILDLIIKNKKI
jgi:hypothetical protein